MSYPTNLSNSEVEEYLIKKSTLTEIASAIREKVGASDKMTPSEMPEKIAAIETGIWERLQKGLIDEWIDHEIVILETPLFANNANLKKVSSNSLTSITALTFYGTKNLKEVNLPNLKKLSRC
jgi:hypothetical protein